ncbi:hypothetical protein FA13DRAFT_674769 [Coprinellus micaceus]|uniref:HNH nuclease domain-containing protein n=1 Tax=Coprinellus micaceus TaxID=71717 RepID=A0A4Y7T702_COPMI|nr:hypothetical protein FA13DRAFT_674769 [Coprinellus micaceus]
MTAIPAVARNKPLPPNPFHEVDEVAFHDAYHHCLLHEKDAQLSKRGATTKTKEEQYTKEIVYGRCLGYLLTETSHTNGKRMVSDDIIKCDGQREKMNELAETYINHLIRLFRQDKGATPAPSEHPSRLSFDRDRDFFSGTIEPTPKDHRAAKRAALKRDNYRCMVTGCVESAAWYVLESEGSLGEGDVSTSTNFCHIFPPSTNQGRENPSKQSYAESAWKYVYAFGGIKGLEELEGAGIHRLSNGLTLAADLHAAFDNLGLWFESKQDGPENTYLIRTMTPMRGVTTTEVTFTSTDPALELPDGRYLKLHAAICRVAHMSGAAEYMDKHDRDLEELSVLAPDGSSAELFTAHLHQRCVLAYQ